MIVEKAARIIDARVDEVFEFMADLDRVPQWVAGVRQARVLEGDPCAVGGRVAHVNEFMGRTFESTFEVVEWMPNELMAFNVLSGPLRGTSRETLVAMSAETTKVEIEVEGDATGVFRFMGAIAGRAARQQLETSLDNLKKLIEQERRNDSRTPTR